MNGGFDQAYWDANFAHPEVMDGIGNAREHARYLKSFFEVEGVEIDTIADFGFGFGVLFREMLHLFSPSRALGIDPSEFAHQRAAELQLDPYNRIDVALRRQRLEDWCTGPEEEFDLGVCMSVLQYLDDQAIADCLPILADRVQYLYLTVPTDVELQRQIDECDFKDTWAIHRGRERYLELIAPSFTVVSSRVLESRSFHDERSTSFTDLLYRF